MKDWSNLARVVYQRTYARADSGKLETWPETVARVIKGNVYRVNGPGAIEEGELDRLEYFMLERKATPAGRGLWFSGAPAHFKLGGAALNNCWFTTAGDWENFVLAQDLLMLGGGVGMSVEHQFVSKLPRIKKDVSVTHRDTNDADYIIPDSREGWCEFTRRILKAFFVTGRPFSFSTVCLRGAGEAIRGFGGKASGPLPLIEYASKLNELLQERQGKHIRPIDAGDIMCLLGEMVVSGNVRRSAIILLGDPWDKEYLKAKRWDLGILPTQRSRANFSVVCDDTEDLHPLYWKTYEVGEPFGIFNRKNAQKYGRMGELKKDPCIGLNPCLTGDTLVYVADGRGEVSIGDLANAGEDVPVFCIDDKQEVVVRFLRHPRLTGHKQKIIKIGLENGHYLRATCNHKLRTSDGTIKEVRDLVIGDGLKTLTKYEAGIHEVIKNSNSKSQDYYWVSFGQRKTKAEHRIIAEFYRQAPIKLGEVVHHKDRNGRNNSPLNLEIMSKKDHDTLHVEAMMGDKNPMRRAKHEWSQEKWLNYKTKQSKKSSGYNNRNCSGVSHEQLKEHAIKLTQKLGRRFSNQDWIAYASSANLPTGFSKWRKDHLNGVLGLAKWAAAYVGYDDYLNVDPRCVKTYMKLTSEGYDCSLTPTGIVINKNCEVCGNHFSVASKQRERAYCSSSCSNVRTWNNSSFRTKRILGIKIAHNLRKTVVKEQQIMVFNNLKCSTGLIPEKKEWIRSCKNSKVSAEISRSSSPFRSYDELKDAASSFNHRVISIQDDGYEDVYNGTVDEFHNFFVGSFQEKTASNKNKWLYVNNFQCGESTLEDAEPCNLVEHFLPNIKDEREFLECSRLMFRYAKRVCLEQYHHEKINAVVHKNQRVGLGISGCLSSPLFNEKTLDKVYKAIQKENELYSQKLGQPQSIRTTLVKPGGTVPLVAGPVLPGIHAAWSRHMIRRVRFAANDDLVPILSECGHHIEPELLFDGTYNQGTKVVDFYIKHDGDIPCADEDFTTWKQLNTLLFAQKWWADQAVSVTVYYRKEEIPEIKKWLEMNISNIKSISFLCHNDHGFKQAPMEKITEEQYVKLSAKIKPISDVTSSGELIDELGCEGGACPIK